MKKIGLVISVVVLVMIAFYVGLNSRGIGNKEADYSSISSFEQSTGNAFYNFYEPRWYLSREKNKTTLKKLDEVSILYSDNTKQEYWISYENIDQYGTYIYLGIDRSGKGWESDNKRIINQDGYKFETALYDKRTGKMRVCEVHFVNEKLGLRIIVELGTKVDNPMNDELMLQNCIDMIEDSFEIN